jgi:hypothetical protein
MAGSFWKEKNLRSTMQYCNSRRRWVVAAHPQIFRRISVGSSGKLVNCESGAGAKVVESDSVMLALVDKGWNYEIQ